jgi:hypothetical protein
MKLQKRPHRKPHDTPKARQLTIKLKKKHNTQAYWAAIREMIDHSIKRRTDKCQIAIDSALLLTDEGYNKYPLETEKESND